MSSKQPTFDELWSTTDFSDLDSITLLFPSYVQEQHRLKSSGKKNISKAVDIELFTLKTPLGDQVLLKDTGLKIEANRRACLYGPNSSGKTLLFHNMSHAKIKDFPKHLHVHHMQELEGEELNDTVINTVVKCHPYRNALIKVEERLKELMKDASIESDKKDKISENLDYVQMQARSIRAYDIEERAKAMLRVLGFDDEGQRRPVSALSGGLRMRVGLAMAFIIDADLLLLDEPTNHLDFPSVLWLENRLRAYRGSFLIVSHDRELLNNVVTGVILIEDKQLKYYPSGFKEFEKKKAMEDKQKNDEIEKFLMKNRNADPSTMLGRQKADKQAWQHAYLARQVALQGKFTFPQATALSNAENLPLEDIKLIDLQNVTFSYHPQIENPIYIFQNPISFMVTASTRAGVMGPNGAGKSTLLKLLTNKLTATTGTVKHHPEYILAYFGQHSTAELDLEMTALEWMVQQFPKEPAGALRNHLSKTGIVGGVAETRMKALSYSQRSCIIFAKLTYVCPHLLILDEPTNFLDLESVDSLISACNKYKGALLLVSHNRDFLKKCAKQYLSVVPGAFQLFNNMKQAEQATYTFIQEMEEGTGGGKVSGNALAVGGSLSTYGKGGQEEKKEEAAQVKVENGVRTLSISTSAASNSGAGFTLRKKEKEAVEYKVNEKIEAQFTDGKWYKAEIKKFDPAKKTYSVLYLDYGNTEQIKDDRMRKIVVKAPKKPGSPNKK
jgi:ATPase subunit of ABC transporter with duplicated ATPase domains